jgi:hypothetical protein
MRKIDGDGVVSLAEVKKTRGELTEDFALSVIALKHMGLKDGQAVMGTMSYFMAELKEANIASVRVPRVDRDASGFHCEDLDVFLTNFVGSKRTDVGLWSLTDSGKAACAMGVALGFAANPESARMVMKFVGLDCDETVAWGIRELRREIDLLEKRNGDLKGASRSHCCGGCGERGKTGGCKEKE